MGKFEPQGLGIAELVRDCDEMLREGRVSGAANRLKGLNLSQTPRRWREPLAKICRRAGLFEKGLRLLQPVVRQERELNDKPNSREISEYAALLSRIGSISEALTLLESIPSEEAADALLYRGYCHVMQWNYQDAVQMFEAYLKTDAGDYFKLVASVNLASAYVLTGQWTSAITLLDEIRDKAQERGATRLLANAYELRGQISLAKGNLDLAQIEFKRAMGILGPSQSLDQLLVRKGLAIVQARHENSLQPLLNFRIEAEARGHWDSVREAELYLLQIRFDRERFDHLVIGSPLQGYKRRVTSLLQAEPSESYLLGGKGQRLLFDLTTGEIQSYGSRQDGLGLKQVKGGQKLHQLLNAMIRDFYSPLNIGYLFSSVYPQEYFNVYSSPLKVRQLVSRARQWMEKEKIPAEILRSRNGYTFRRGSGLAIRVDHGPLSVDSPNDIYLTKLRRLFPEGTSFSAAEACHALDLPRTGFHRFAANAMTEGRLEKLNGGKWTVYRIPFLSTSKRQAA